MLGSDVGAHRMQIVEQGLPAARTEVPGLVSGGQGGAVSSVVVSVDREPVRGDHPGYVVVPADVFAHAVDQHNDARDLLISVRRPAKSGELSAICRLQGEFLGDHYE